MLDIYYSIKILHVISAVLLLASASYWLIQRYFFSATSQNLNIPVLVVTPLALLQLLTGFTIISVKHYAYSAFWVWGTFVGFITLLSLWFSVVFLALQNTEQTPKQRLIKRFCLSLLLAVLLFMLFLMANRPELL